MRSMSRWLIAAAVGLVTGIVFGVLDGRDEWNYFVLLGAFAALTWTLLAIIGYDNMQRLDDALRRRRAHRR